MSKECEHDWEWEDDWECSVDPEGGYNEVNNGYWSCQICGEKDFHTAPPAPDADEYLVECYKAAIDLYVTSSRHSPEAGRVRASQDRS